MGQATSLQVSAAFSEPGSVAFGVIPHVGLQGQHGSIASHLGAIHNSSSETIAHPSVTQVQGGLSAKLPRRPDANLLQRVALR
jgi:hypothetical protein